MGNEWYNSEFLRLLEEKLKGNNKYSSEVELLRARQKIISMIEETSIKFNSERFNKDLLIEPLENIASHIEKNLKILERECTAIIIVKDEERCIERCILSIIDMFDYIVVIDTGSKDKTKEKINSIKNSKINLFNYSWNNNFADARNFGISKVKKGWIFFIDADEYIESKNTKYELRNILNSFNRINNVKKLTICPSIMNHNGHNVITARRIFLKESEIIFYGKVHEEPRKNNEKLEYISLKIEVMHDGYDIDIMKSKNKIQRNYNLLKEMIVEEANNPRWSYFFIRDGASLIGKKEVEKIGKEAVALNVNLPLDKNNIKMSEYTFAILDILCRVYIENKEYDKLKSLIEILDSIYPNNDNTIYYKTISEIIRMKEKQEDLLVEVINYRKRNYKINPGMIHSQGYHIDFLIAVLLFETSNYENSFKYFKFLEDKYIEESFFNKYKKVFKIDDKYEFV